MASRRLQYCCKNGSGPLAPKRVRRVAPALKRALPRLLAGRGGGGGGNGRKALGASQRLIPRALRMWTCQSSLQQIKSIVVMCPIASGKKRKKSCCCYCCHHRLARQAKLARKGRTIARGAARRTVGQRNQECKETSRIKCVSHVEKLDLRFLHNKNEWIVG